jgi:polyphosphate kinase 2 (PPK2 family)
VLETLDLKRSLSKQEFRKITDPLEIRLGELQRTLRAEKIATLLVFEGWDAAGKGTMIGSLIQPLDPRGFRVHADRPPTEDEAMRPFLWRFWRRLPPAGEIAIFDRSWYRRVLIERIERISPKGVWRGAYASINDFESTLTDSGLVLLKFWLHISKKEQRKRLRKLEKDRAERWKVSRDDWRQHRRYEDYVEAVEEMVARTSTATAPWTVVEAEDRRFATAKVFETIAAAWSEAASRKPPAKVKAPATPVESKTRLPTVLQVVDLDTAKLSEADYEEALPPLQNRMRALEHEIYAARIPVTIVCEGWDAAGKGGAIRRLTSKLDPRGFDVIGIAAPNDEERAHHYLWRFWRQVPKAGHIAIFDRSWYGRVLVERVEGFCAEDEWRRAYREINEFESQLVEAGGSVLKLWFHIDRDTQLKRFKERERIGYKKWKITGEDWRNREKWPRYEEAVAEMIQRTSTTYAPWKVIAANDKYHARIEVLRAVIASIESTLESHGAKTRAKKPARKRGK